jgi:hypothetical protein
MNRNDLLLDVAQALKCEVQDIPGALSDSQLNSVFEWARGTAAVKRSRGDLPIPSYKIGRSRRTPLSAVIKFKLDQIQGQYDRMEIV